MPGRYLEEFTVGEVIHHAATRSVTEVDNILFSTLSMNPQPLHLDYHFAAQSIHGKPLVNGMFTFALMMGLTVNETTLGTTEGNLGFEKVGFPNPVFYGDTIRAETEVLAVRPSRSRPGLGIVSFRHSAINQHGDIVVTCERAGLMRTRGHQDAQP
ncbi:MaoC family dehydratase [Alcaligenaceae bacterium]|nr:MaoC family dehydratase [Alcaligenaceae bacterium]